MTCPDINIDFMKLIETTFDNFRCFKQYRITYGNGTTIFFGKNGTGKSSILSAIRRGLSFMFAKPKNFTKNLAISNQAKVRAIGKTEANFDYASRVYNYPVQNDYRAVFNNEVIDWSLTKKTMDGGLLTTRYKDALNTVMQYYNDDLSSPLPVLSVITDSFPHQTIKMGTMVTKLITKDILPRDLAYYGWDERTNCTELWLNRFYRVSDILNAMHIEMANITAQMELYDDLIQGKEEPFFESKLNERKETFSMLTEKLKFFENDNRYKFLLSERDYITGKLLDFTKPLNEAYNFINRDFELFRVSMSKPDKKNYTLEFSFKDGRVITFDSLPMGYKRLFSLIIDIAYRSYILNNGMESEGIVLIDEIELHLHPTLQQEVVQRLRNTFPNIQFIITTHSPLVLSNFKVDAENKIIKLENDGNNYSYEEIDNVFGLDYSTNLSEVMDVAPRSSTIEKFINAYLFLYGKKKIDEADEILAKLKEYVGGTIPKLLQKEIEEQKKTYEK